MRTDQITLPGGFIDPDGKLHRHATIRALTGREEELLTDYSYPSAELVTELICLCVSDLAGTQITSPQIARSLLVGDREYILLMLRKITFGDRVESTLRCPWPNCGKNIDIDFRISDIPVTQAADLRPVYTLADANLEFRLPTGADQEYIGSFAQLGPAKLSSVVLQRCLVRIGENRHPDLETVLEMESELRKRIEKEMEALAPNLDLTMEMTCPECRREFVAPFELQDFFFSEVKTNLELLYREIHYLAFHYHWSESEIMSMPRQRRRDYIRVLSDEIERINDAAH